MISIWKIKQSSNIVEILEVDNLGLLAALEQQYRHLSEIEIDEMTCFMCNVRSEIPTNDTMPCRIVFLVKFLLDICGNILQRD